MGAPGARAYDVVLFGASGFTGGLTAEYLGPRMPAHARWAVAGRDRGSLDPIVARMRGSVGPQPDIVLADVGDPRSLREMAGSTRVLATTVGPYSSYGDPVVAACAAAGTDYLDLTGEPEFVDRTWLAHNATARDSGARLVHSCGFDSIPTDLGVWLTVSQLPTGQPVTVEGFLHFAGRPSSGTARSAIIVGSRLAQAAAAGRRRRAAEGPPPGGRRVRCSGGDPLRPVRRWRGRWALPLPVIDTSVVARSARLIERYGPDFAYHHYVLVDHLAPAVGLVIGAAPLLAAAALPPARRALLRRFPSGRGPSAEQRAKSFFELTLVGVAGGVQVATRVSGGDPGYDETAKMLAESALCLAFDDDLPHLSGQLTPAAAMGDALLRRLRRAGIRFEVSAGQHPPQA